MAPTGSLVSNVNRLCREQWPLPSTRPSARYAASPPSPQARLRFSKRDTRRDHGCSPQKETDIPVDPLLPRDGLVDVMQPEQLVIREAFYQAEESKPDEEAPPRSFVEQDAWGRRLGFPSQTRRNAVACSTACDVPARKFDPRAAICGQRP